MDVPILSGFVTVAQQSGFSIKPITKKFCLLFKASRHGIERLEIAESETDKNPKIVTLENCVKITQEPAPANQIHIVTKTGSLSLNPATEEDLKLWLNALQSVAFKEKADSAVLSRSNSAIEEDNDLYCSSYGDGVFVINLIKTEASQRCNIPEIMYKLSLGATDLHLVAFEDEKKVIAKWPYRYIRKYGYRDGHFTFEAGRKCNTGEGNFCLDHVSPQEIFRCMSTKMKSMKKLLNGDPSLNAEEAQLSVAVSSMEAGSRSPIPLFPTTPSSDFDINSASSAQLHHSFASVRGFLSSTDSLSNVSTTSSSIPLLKHIPNKPPRKTGAVQVTVPEASSSSSTKLPELPKRNQPQPGTTPVREYESIETITDAWKTLGIDEVRHTENVSNKDQDLIDFAAPRAAKKELLLLDSKPRTGGKMLVEIHPDVDTDDDDEGENEAAGEGETDTYDHLEYFRSNSKTSSAYKTVIPISPPSTAPTSQTSSSGVGGISLTQLPATTTTTAKKPSTANDDYEIIGAPVVDTKTCRMADDSYLGYGVLRRPMGLPLPPLPPLPNAIVAAAAVKKSPSAAEANKGLTSGSGGLGTPTRDEVLLKNSAILLTDATTAMCEKRIEMLANGDLVEDVDDVLGHRKYNGLDYAIVSKPKRV